jgi:lysophospholipase L1-like esterase
MKQRRGVLLLVVTLALSAGLVPPVGIASQASAATPTDAALPAEWGTLAVTPDPAGGLWAAWQAGDGTDAEIYVSRRTTAGWLAAQPVQSRPEAWDRFPSLAIDGDGRPWLAWASASRAQPNRRELMISHWAAGRWSEPQQVPLGSALSAADPVLAGAPDGSLWLAWSGRDGVDEEIFASHWDGQAWSPPVRVSAEDRDRALYDRHPRLAIAPDGQVWLAWTTHQGGTDDEIAWSRWTGSRWTPERLLSADDALLDGEPSLAVDASGTPWVAWHGRVTVGDHSHRRILVSQWDAARNAWRAEQVASLSIELAVEEEDPTLALDAQGRLHLAWLAHVSGGSGVAVGHSTWLGSDWSEPELVRSGLKVEEGIVAAATGAAHLELLWLDPTSSLPAPVGVAAAEGSGSLAGWAQQATPDDNGVQGDSIPNRTLGFGDSITWGFYGNPSFYPYPSVLNDTMDNRVRPWDVINSGLSGEQTRDGMDRIGGEVGDYLPRYVLLMEGTNDVSHRRDPAEVGDNLRIMIDITRRSSKPMRLLLGTLIPRKDDFNDETDEMNRDAIWAAANDKGVPVCDQWEAFYAYGDWESIYWDDKHPDQTGLNLIASTFYACQLREFGDIYEDTTSPSATLNSLPPESPCEEGIAVSWSGTDNADGTGVANYDVQVRVDNGAWANWLVEFPNTSAVYTNLSQGDLYYFRVRARDRAGNVSAWTPEQWTDVRDTSPPYEVHVNRLPIVRLHPFRVSWGASDACSGVASYSVQYRVDDGPTWHDWQIETDATSATSDPTWACGHNYYFRAKACDEGGYCTGWSTPLVSTILACYGLGGELRTVREQPVAGASVSVSPTPLLLERGHGEFLAYLINAGSYDVSVSRSGLGPLPSMLDVPVSGDMRGLEFFLPPLDDAVEDGDLETGNLAAWDVSGDVQPYAVAHTGQGSARLDGTSGRAALGQFVSPPAAISDPTLSFMVRLVDELDPPALLEVELWPGGVAALPVTYTVVVDSDNWTHVWFDLSGMASDPLTINFVTSDGPAILLDEVSLGSDKLGGVWVNLPLISRRH